MTDKTEKACRTLLTELNKALIDRTSVAVQTRTTLRDAVCDYVAVEQARGTTLQEVIQTVKDILKNAESEAATDTARNERKDDTLAKQLVQWCVEFHQAAADLAAH